jgi:hypothetical protein
MAGMIYPDPATAHLFVRQRQDGYQLEAECVRRARRLVKPRRRARRRGLAQVGLRLARFAKSLG